MHLIHTGENLEALIDTSIQPQFMSDSHVMVLPITTDVRLGGMSCGLKKYLDL